MKPTGQVFKECHETLKPSAVVEYREFDHSHLVKLTVWGLAKCVVVSNVAPVPITRRLICGVVLYDCV